MNRPTSSARIGRTVTDRTSQPATAEIYQPPGANARMLSDLLRRLNPVLRGWCTYFQYGVSKRTFGYLGHFAYRRVRRWVRSRHNRSWRSLRRRFYPEGRPTQDGIVLFDPAYVTVSRYRRRTMISLPWTAGHSSVA